MKRRFVILILFLLVLGAYLIDLNLKKPSQTIQPKLSEIQIQAQLFSKNGFKSQISLSDSVLKLVEAGVIDQKKFLDLYSKDQRQKIKLYLTNRSDQLIILNHDNSRIYLNLLWPLGLANKTTFNKNSPINDKDLESYASTAGWTLGLVKSGAKYFNRHQIINLTENQEKLVLKVAENSYRPCCDNHAFFQDCNHGSALLGLLELGASQGLTEDQLFSEALGFNTYWFPNQYLKTASYFYNLKNKSWSEVDPKLIFSQKYSSSSGWQNNVNQPLKRSGLFPKESQAGSSC